MTAIFSCSSDFIDESRAWISPDEQDTHEASARHQLSETDELLLACLVRTADEGDCVHARRSTRVLAEQFEAGEVHEHMCEQICAFEQHPRELRHDFTRLFDTRSRQQRERAAQPTSGEDGTFVIYALPTGKHAEAGIADVRVDHCNRCAGEIA